MKRRSITLVSTMIAACIVVAPRAHAQRGERTSTTPTRPPSRADYMYTDLACRVIAFRKIPTAEVPISDLVTAGGEFSFGAAAYGVPIPDGGVSTWSSWRPEVYAIVLVSNKGTKQATFQTRVTAWRPPGAWSFVDPKTTRALAESALTITATLESGVTQALPFTFYLKPTAGRHAYAVQATTDVANAVEESDDTNNVCRFALTLDDGTGQ